MSKLDQFESAEITTEDLENVAGGFGFWGGVRVNYKSNTAVVSATNVTNTVGLLNFVATGQSISINQS
jgi:hypothetical protein